MATPLAAEPLPEGIFSLLDTDLYKLTMQSAVLKYFPDVEATYSFTNRTPHMRLNRDAFNWLQAQVERLANIRLAADELAYLRTTCPSLNASYLRYLSKFQFDPSSQIRLEFKPTEGDLGDLEVHIGGLWVESILYEVPILALTSEAYFRFCDRDWTYDGQVAQAKSKGIQLMQNGCAFSEFGTRRRRDYHTHDLVMKGLVEAQKECEEKGWKGKLAGTSNVHFAMRFGIPLIGTVAHEWFMGVAAITQDYESANETALRYWVAMFGKGVMAIALTDTFGTRSFLEAFRRPVLPITTSTSSTDENTADAAEPGDTEKQETYAQVYTGTRQDSGDPIEYVETLRSFYESEGITERKTIVFSDSLNVEKCIQYKDVAERAGINPSFGVGTFLTNDFRKASSSSGEKSYPLNIVIKISSAAGNHAVKISDDLGKNTGDEETVKDVKRRLGYQENPNSDARDESKRW